LLHEGPRADAKTGSQRGASDRTEDAVAIEKTGSFKGQYFVLLGAISPSEGRGPDDVDLNKLFRRLEDPSQTVI
jgi:recombinational DNA repair protein RecR